MKKTTGLLLLAAFSLLTIGTVLHGCGSQQDAASPPAPAAVKFTIVGAGT